VVELAKSLQAELEITILFSGHELNPLFGALDRVLYLGRGKSTLGTVEEVIAGRVLSRLYGSEIDVVRLKGRICACPAAATWNATSTATTISFPHAHDLRGVRQGDV
jgi:ABC-type Mn2+/Zn2+ transport system ATPase subunit